MKKKKKFVKLFSFKSISVYSDTMVIQKFPGANLIGQFLKQITEPLSKFIVKHVKKRPFIRKHVLIKLGHLYYWYEDKAVMPRIPAIAKKKRIDDDIRTMELGAKLLIEVITKSLRVTHTNILIL